MLSGLLDHSVEEVSVQDFVEVGEGVYFIDARERKEFDVSHIDGAQWVGYEDFDMERVKGLEKADTIIVYCSVGYRSEKITEKLIDAGYMNAKNLYGGIFEWKNQDGTVVDDEGSITDSVHAFDRAWGIWLNKGKKVYN